LQLLYYFCNPAVSLLPILNSEGGFVTAARLTATPQSPQPLSTGGFVTAARLIATNQSLPPLRIGGSISGIVSDGEMFKRKIERKM
jgi:hypothetical protein